MGYLKRSIHLFAGLLLCLVTAVTTANEIEIGDDHYLIFYHSDALGSPLAVTNHNGNVLWYEHSEPYGKTMTRVSQTGQEILNDRVGTRKGYTGHLNDTAADLVYMKARYYDPQIGRFYSNDSVGFTASNPMMFNRYAYGNNNPYVYVDPKGTYPTKCNDCDDNGIPDNEQPPHNKPVQIHHPDLGGRGGTLGGDPDIIDPSGGGAKGKSKKKGRGRGKNKQVDKLTTPPSAEQQKLISMAQEESKRIANGDGPISDEDADTYIEMANELGVPVRAKANDLSGAHGYGNIESGPSASHIHINGVHVPVSPWYVPPAKVKIIRK